MNLGQSIRELRKHKGLKQCELSNRIDISQAYLSGIETGNRTPSMDVIEKISKSLNIPIPIMFWFGLSESDVSEGKIYIYKQLKPSVDTIIREIFT